MIAIIDLGIGNVRSVYKSVECIGSDCYLATTPSDLKRCERIILPGVGTFSAGMERLRLSGFDKALDEYVLKQKRPFLGLCLGMHLASKKGEEGGDITGLGWVEADVVPLARPSSKIKLPHMGWNFVNICKKTKIFQGLPDKVPFYFVHRYHFVPCEVNGVIATCEHGVEFVCAYEQDNITLLQFHPEKSQDVGLQVIENFATL